MAGPAATPQPPACGTRLAYLALGFAAGLLLLLSVPPPTPACGSPARWLFSTSSSSSSNRPTGTFVPQPLPTHPAVVPAIVEDEARDVLPEVAAAVVQLAQQGQGRKLIAMSLCGNSSRYCDGAIANALLARQLWTGWTLRFYYGSDVAPSTLRVLHELGAELVPMHSTRGCASWRFLAAGDRSATHVIMRDADARLGPRDHLAVREWVANSGAWPFHVMSDHKEHHHAVMAGMWGVVGGFLHPRLIDMWGRPDEVFTTPDADRYGYDQDFLAQRVWPLVANMTLKHASWHCRRHRAAQVKGFPSPRINNRDFVGNVFRLNEGFQGLQTVGSECPKECRRKQEWTQC